MQENTAAERTQSLGELAAEIVDLIHGADVVIDGVLGSDAPDSGDGTGPEPVVPPVGQSLNVAISRLQRLNRRLEGLKEQVGLI